MLHTINQILYDYWIWLIIGLVWYIIAVNRALLYRPVKYWKSTAIGAMPMLSFVILPLPLILRWYTILVLSAVVIFSSCSKRNYHPGYSSIIRFLALLPPNISMPEYKQVAPSTNQLWVPRNKKFNLDRLHHKNTTTPVTIRSTLIIEGITVIAVLALRFAQS